MRNVIYIVSMLALIFSSCGNMKKLETFDDDAYFDPVRDKKKEQVKNADTLTTASRPKAVAPDTAKNPYYSDPQWNRDDYYDFEYAARLRRFGSTSMALAYYDPYYTNSYFYDYNPYHYGVSIYNGYAWYGPSYWNYNYNPTYNWGGWYGCGNNFGWGYYTYPSSYFYAPSPWMYSYWDPYAYSNNWWYWNNPYWYNPYYSDPYCQWYAPGGYNSCNPGYYNAHDYNSYYYGPRLTHSGTNPVVVNPSTKKVAAPGGNNNSSVNNVSGNNAVTTAAPAPYDPERFNVIPRQNLSIQNYNTPVPVHGGGNKPVRDIGTVNDPKSDNNVNTIGSSPNEVKEPQKGFWGKVLGGDKDVKANNSAVTQETEQPQPAGGNTNVPGKNNVVPKNSNVPAKSNTPDNTPRKNIPRNTPAENNYTPVETPKFPNSNNNYTPKNNTPVTPPATPNSGTPGKKPR